MREFLIALSVYLASGAINYALAFKTPEQWADYASSNPTGAAARRALRKCGFDLPGLIRLVQRGLAARASKGGRP